MECGYARLTVFFEDPFWVGVYEREDGGYVEACKITFGGEPKDFQVYQWLLEGWRGLAFSPRVRTEAPRRAEGNPKRRQRAAAAQLQKTSTKAQQALQLQREQSKTQRQARRREGDIQAAERKFVLRQEKKRQKHRGH